MFYFTCDVSGARAAKNEFLQHTTKQQQQDTDSKKF